MKEQHYARALHVGRTGSDPELVFATLAYLGASLVHDDRVEEGMLLLDEALAGVAGGEVEDFIVVEEIFCQLFSACERAQDVQRAEQWIRVGEAIAERRRLPAVSAYCRTHYGGILTAAGRWPEADEALTEAVELWALGRRTLKAGALVRLANLRVKQGRLEEAERLLAGMSNDAGGDAAAGVAAARSGSHGRRARDARTSPAAGRSEQQRRRTDPRAAHRHPSGQRRPRRCRRSRWPPSAACAEIHPSAYAAAVLALARGRIALATGTGDPRAWLRDALDGFATAQLPLEAALCRLDLARAFGQDSPEVAVAEARAALLEFERLTAARQVDAAQSLLRRLGARVSPARSDGNTLTRREQDVLTLLGEGLSNPEIAGRLFISRKTVEHHVGNVLDKLGLRNRSEAAAYVVRAGTDSGRSKN